MPLIKKTKENNCQIAVWDIQESLEELIKLSNNLDIAKFKKSTRQIEFILSRLLLNELLPNAKISYNKNGAPLLRDNNFISISHSKDLVSVITSKRKVGLDIEKISTRTLKLASKFISQENHSNLTAEKTTLIWCCKEAIFKWHQRGNINYINDIKIFPFIIREYGELIAEFKNQQHTLYYKRINAHFLVYVCS